MRTIEHQKELNAVRFFTVAYTAVFTALAITSGDYKFLFYTIYMIVMTWIISHYYQRLHFGIPLICMISIFGLLHLMGSAIYVDGTRLYELAIGVHYIHFDNIVHTFGGGLAALIAHNILQNHLDEQMKHHPIPFIFILVTMASGFGAYNEIIELGMVLTMGDAAKVGDYLNNAFDLVCNFNGALIASTAIYLWKYRRNE
jgi:uncharacterized membrane protein YjdF